MHVLTEEASRQLDQILTELLERVEAEAVFLCDRGGNIIASHAISSYAHQENIAALASGSFFATLEMARLIGEDEFKYLLHQGEKNSIYMESAPGDMLLLVVFSKDSNPGLVKLFVRNASEQLKQFHLDEALRQSKSPTTGVSLQFEMDENAQPFVQQDPDKK
ncbi:MAG: roadblock/LC7 domain-containing protein [Lentisphaerota bacterium]